MTLDRAKNTPITLYPTEIEIVSDYAKANGMNFSGAIRHIIHQWETMSKAGIYIGHLPCPDDASPVPIVYVPKE